MNNAETLGEKTVVTFGHKTSMPWVQDHALAGIPCYVTCGCAWTTDPYITTQPQPILNG